MDLDYAWFAHYSFSLRGRLGRDSARGMHDDMAKACQVKKEEWIWLCEFGKGVY